MIKYLKIVFCLSMRARKQPVFSSMFHVIVSEIWSIFLGRLTSVTQTERRYKGPSSCFLLGLVSVWDEYIVGGTMDRPGAIHQLHWWNLRVHLKTTVCDTFSEFLTWEKESVFLSHGVSCCERSSRIYRLYLGFYGGIQSQLWNKLNIFPGKWIVSTPKSSG